MTFFDHFEVNNDETLPSAEQGDEEASVFGRVPGHPARCDNHDHSLELNRDTGTDWQCNAEDLRGTGSGLYLTVLFHTNTQAREEQRESTK